MEKRDKKGVIIRKDRQKVMADNQTDFRTSLFCPGPDLITIARQFAHTPALSLLSNFHKLSGAQRKLQLENLTNNGSWQREMKDVFIYSKLNTYSEATCILQIYFL